MNKYDVIVIGAGPGGYPCAIRLGQLKKKVLVIEAKYLGGLCLNWGCIPTKALSYAAEMFDIFSKAQKMGFKISVDGLDLNSLRNWKDDVVKRLRTGIEYLFKANNVEWRQGKGKILSEHTVEFEKDGAKELFEANHIIIATGTQVVSLPGLDFDGRYIINTDDAVELKNIPKSLLVVGAGASGLEMASIYARLGSKVAVVEIMSQILPGMETEVCENIYKILKKFGIEIFLDSQITSHNIKNQGLEVVIKKPDGELKDLYDQILVTVGRRPNPVFGNFGIKTDKSGYILVDETLRTNIKNIFAIGDVIGPPLLAHKATRQGIVCAEIIGGYASKVVVQSIPSCVFTIPPFSSVGLTEKAALEQGYKVKIGRFPYRASGKALSMLENEGFVKIVGDEHGKLLGLHILGAESPSLIGEAVLALNKGLLVADLAETIHPHPTLTEIIHEAAENFYQKAIHIENK